MKRIAVIFIYVLVALGLVFSLIIGVRTPISVFTNHEWETTEVVSAVIAYAFMVYIILTSRSWMSFDKELNDISKEGTAILTIVLTVFVFSMLGIVIKVLS